MKKPKIYATGNLTKKGRTNVSYYIIEKNEGFHAWLKRFLIEFGVKGEVDVVEVDSSEGYVVMGKDLAKMVDVHESYGNENIRVDLFYGVERVFMTLSCEPDKREEFGKKMLSETEWIKVEKPSRPWLTEIRGL
jgi:hypothetical protein